jgi:hypothetical protein
MLSAFSVRVCDVGCRNLVPKRHPTCRPAPWMGSNEICGLSILQVNRHCQHRQYRNRKINRIRDNECAIWDGIIRTSAKHDGMQCIGLDCRNPCRTIDWESNGYSCDWEVCYPEGVGDPNSDLVPTDGGVYRLPDC